MKNSKLKFAFVAAIFLLLGQVVNAQDKSDRPSPPKTAEATVNGGEIVIDYSSPAVKDRTVWGDLVPYDKVWRTGANEATTIMFEKDVTIDGKDVSAGKYSLFTIPAKDNWTVILNKTWDQWGHYKYDTSKDALRFEVEPQATSEMQERLVFNVSENGLVEMMWENLQISFQVE